MRSGERQVRLSHVLRLRSSLPTILALVMLFSSGGCSIFGPVGTFFSQGYRNTVAYFNAYYNAERLYVDAEGEVLAAQRQYDRNVIQGSSAPFVVPATAKQKFNLVIDKCSNILAFHTSSDLVVDALFLVGKSYQLQGEDVKAERKFTELLATYPESEYRLEVQVRLGTVLREQGRRSEARQVLEASLAGAEAAEDEEITALALGQLAMLSREDGDSQGAAKYYGRLAGLSGEDEQIVGGLLAYAQLLLEEGKPEEALSISDGVEDVTDDPFLLYRALDVSISAMQKLGRHTEAMDRIAEGIEDFRFGQQTPFLRLRLAEILAVTGREPEAIEEYQALDTLHYRQEVGARSSQELAKIAEREGNYDRSKKYFERAAALTTGETGKHSRTRLISVTSLIGAKSRLAIADSVLTALRDTLQEGDARIDSLDRITFGLMQEIGEWYFSEGAKPDTARDWLVRSLEQYSDRPLAARALYILADIEGSGTERSKEYHASIVDRFPDSPYANESRKALGLQESEKSDPSEQIFEEAERESEQGGHERAVQLYDSVSKAFPDSPLAAKSALAAAWVYEYRLQLPDSAMSRYQMVIRSSKETTFLNAARLRLAQLTKDTSTDSTAIKNPDANEAVEKVDEKKPTVRERIE